MTMVANKDSVRSPKKPIVNVIIPAMNEEETIGLVLDDIKKVIQDLEYEFKIIVVNDHSKDRTVQIAQDKGATVLTNKGRPGKGNSLKVGFENSDGDYIVMMDGDYSHKAEDLPLLLKALSNGAGLVVGSRILGGSEEYTLIRALGNILLTAFFGMCYSQFLTDALNGYKAFKKEIIKDYKYHSKDFDIEIELLVNTLRSGRDITEVASHERARAGGRTKSKVVRHGLKFFFRIIKELLRNMIKYRGL